MTDGSTDRSSRQSWLQARISALTGAVAKLAGLDSSRHEPGFLGSVPYVLVLRYLITLAVALRFYVHRPQYSTLHWFHCLLIIAAFVAVNVVATYVAFNPALRRSQGLQGTLIIVDVLLISAAYWLTGQYGSDFFLFYYLPIFSSVEHLGGRRAAVLCLGMGFAMLVVAASLNSITMPLSVQEFGVLRVVFLRWSFLVAVGFTSALVFRAASRRQAELSQRQAELQALLNAVHTGASAIPRVQELDGILEFILSELTNKLGFDLAAISLVDEYRHCIETVRGRHISPGWIMRARRSLDDEDIQTFIVNTGETKIIDGPHKLLDPIIYKRFEHWRLVRIWAPIITSQGVVVGTIEAGCKKEIRSKVFTEETIARVENLGRRYGDDIAEKRPHILLRGLAQSVIDFIGAQSATLHVYERSRVQPPPDSIHRWGDLILATGAGKATPEFVRRYNPRPEGKGSKAIQTGEPEVVGPEEVEREYSKLHKLGIRALAVVPLKLGSDVEGVLGIHFWHTSKTLSSREINLAKTFAAEMEGVIQDYLLLRRVTEEGARAWALSGLEKLMQSLTSPFSLPDVLKEIARNALQTLDADNVVVYQYLKDEDRFHVPPVADGDFIRPVRRRLEVQKNDMLHELANEGRSRFVEDVRSHRLLAAEANARYLEFAKREGIQSCATLVLQASDDHEVVGLLFVNFRKRHVFSPEEKRAMDTFVNAAALAIRNARLHKDDLKSQLAAISRVHDAIAAKRDLSLVLQDLLEQTLLLTGAKYGVCIRWNPLDKLLEPIAGWPERPAIKPFPLGEGIVGLAAKSRGSILVDDVQDKNKRIFVEDVGEITPAEIYKKVHPDTRCEIAVPLVDGDELLGVLNIEHPDPCAFTQDDRFLLKTLAVPAIIAFRTVKLYENLERRIRHQKALNLIAARVQAHADDPETIVRLFLTGITASGGLGFSRVMLFLPDEQHEYVKGNSAIGPVTAEQAKEDWEEFDRKRDGSNNDFESLLSVVETTCDLSSLSQLIRQVRVPLDEAGGAVAKALENKTLQIVAFGEPDAFRQTLAGLTKPSDIQHAFAAIPLLGPQTGKIGVLVVDNRFLWKERAIDLEDIEGLKAFSDLLAMSIENAHLQQRLVLEARQEVTGAISNTMGNFLNRVAEDVTLLGKGLNEWKEKTWKTAHRMDTRLDDIKREINPLSKCLSTLPEYLCREALSHLHELEEAVSWTEELLDEFWDFAREDAQSTQETRSTLDELSGGVADAKKALDDFERYIRPEPLKCEVLDLRDIIHSAFPLLLPDCKIELVLPGTPVVVFADRGKIGDVLLELRKNALEAMQKIPDESRLIVVSAASISENGAGESVQISIRDTGPGVPVDILSKIFEPHITTKKLGTGLGLAIVRDIVAAHGGKIEAGNYSDGGAVFTMKLPAKKEA
jgi:GAF domain-containing protein